MSRNFFPSGQHSKFADPFLRPAAELHPSDIKSTYDLCLYMYSKSSLYAAAMNRLCSYFLTEFTMAEDFDENSENSKKLLKVLRREIRLRTFLQRVGIEWAIYGNAFIRVVEPFDRYLVDRRNGASKEIALSSFPEHKVQFILDDMMYEVPDGEDKTVKLPFVDRPSPARKNMSLLLLDPRYVDLDSAHHSSAKRIMFTPPPEMVSRIRSNELHEINNTPRGLLLAISKDADYLFVDGEVQHFKAPTPSGVSESGLGCPNIIWHFEELYMQHVYRHAEASIARDFVAPWRVFTPNITGMSQDLTSLSLLGNFSAEMKRMMQEHKKDFSATHVIPFPVTYNEYGGNAKQFLPHEQLAVSAENLLDGIGIPRELFRGSMQLEQQPISVKMMEGQYAWMGDGFCELVEFISRKVAAAFELGPIFATLRAPAQAYDIEYTRLRMQMAANGEIPRGSIYPEVGIKDPIEAAVAATRENHEIQRRTDEENRKQEKALTQGSMADTAIMAAEQGAGGGQPAGGQQAGGGGLDYAQRPGDDPLSLQTRGEEIAQQWLQMHAQAPNSHRSEMESAEAINPTLFAVAKRAMESMRASAESEGRANLGRS